jgi:hypothetical protein
METRKIIGLVISLAGLLLLMGGFIFGGMGAFALLLIYGVPLIVIGLVIFFNKHEDTIEQINYSTMKGGKNGKK